MRCRRSACARSILCARPLRRSLLATRAMTRRCTSGRRPALAMARWCRLICGIVVLLLCWHAACTASVRLSTTLGCAARAASASARQRGLHCFSVPATTSTAGTAHLALPVPSMELMRGAALWRHHCPGNGGAGFPLGAQSACCVARRSRGVRRSLKWAFPCCGRMTSRELWR